MLNAGRDCWADCAGAGGFCPGFCGVGACCRQGYDLDSPECGGGSVGCFFTHCCTASALSTSPPNRLPLLPPNGPPPLSHSSPPSTPSARGHAVVIEMIASGDVSDYAGPSTRAAVLRALSSAAGLRATPANASLVVSAASVRLEARLPVASASAAIFATQTLASSMSTPLEANAWLAAAGMPDVVVQTAPTVSQVAWLPAPDDAVPPPHPPHASPPPLLPPLWPLTAPPSLQTSQTLGSALIDSQTSEAQRSLQIALLVIASLLLLGCLGFGAYAILQRRQRYAWAMTKASRPPPSIIFNHARAHPPPSDVGTSTATSMQLRDIDLVETLARVLSPSGSLSNLSSTALGGRDEAMREGGSSSPSASQDSATPALTRSASQDSLSGFFVDAGFGMSPASDYADSVREARLQRARRSLVGVLHEMRAMAEPSVGRGPDGVIRVLSPALRQIAEGREAAEQHEPWREGEAPFLSPGVHLRQLGASIAPPLTLGHALRGWARYAKRVKVARHQTILGAAACDIYRQRQLLTSWMAWARAALDWSAEHGRLLKARKLFLAHQDMRGSLRKWTERYSSPILRARIEERRRQERIVKSMRV